MEIPTVESNDIVRSKERHLFLNRNNSNVHFNGHKMTDEELSKEGATPLKNGAHILGNPEWDEDPEEVVDFQPWEKII